ncbi:O-fucosyltransferase 38-like isoform X2 [Primulina eburnea]|uniref:O-fucosyltransferase 38-like isoform X2 n=1 Tax=Primulina eburnea TaxID=1245227 RepID=UPI003C6CB9E5
MNRVCPCLEWISPNQCSTFSDVFDELHFINTLQQDVMIVKELPKELESVPRARKHFTSWSGVSYYEIIHVAKSDSRLANNELPLDIQRLRCRALYHALDFAPSIESLGEVLSLNDGDTTEASGAAAIPCKKIHCLHLRYEKDMLSFTGCTCGLTDAESKELRVMRKGLVELFDKLEDGKLEVLSLSRLVQKLHQNRYGTGGAAPGIKG